LILIRSDSSEQIGTGHVMRCLALAQAAAETGRRATFAMASGSTALKTRIHGEGFEVVSIAGRPGSEEDATGTIEAARRVGAAWVIVDGYHFGETYQRLLVKAGLRLLALDDFGHASHYWAHLVLNQNFDANERIYSHRESHTRLLLGSRYVLLRREFIRWQSWQRPIAPVARRVLVTIGGSDPGNATPKVVEAIRRLGDPAVEALVVVGADNPHYGEIVAMAAEGPPSIEVRHNVQEMPDVMAWADMAVIVFGTSLWELYFMGCPTLTFGRGFLNEPILRDMDRKGLVKYLGFEDAVDPVVLADAMARLAGDADARRAISETTRRLIDGRGAAEVVRAMEQHG
jgi:UDP-2,4-diacetamido-2,4,6-trideoxy-beta-L-altropyranose hydrolase